MLKWEEVEKRKQCVICTWTQTDHEATECHLTNCTGSTLDPTKFNHWQLQNVLRSYVGRNFGWHRPNYKMSLGKFMLAIPIFSYFLTSDALDFVVLILNYFPSQKRLCSVFCSCKKGTMHWIFVVARRMHCVLYLPKASAQLLPPYLNPDLYDIYDMIYVIGIWVIIRTKTQRYQITRKKRFLEENYQPLSKSNGFILSCRHWMVAGSGTNQWNLRMIYCNNIISATNIYNICYY